MVLTDENFEKEISGTEKLVLVDFFATWCEPCTMLAPILDKVAEEMKDKVVLMKANLDDTPNIAGKYGVEKIPTVVLFKSGKPISGFVGLAPEESIKNWLNENLNKMENFEEIIKPYDEHAVKNGFRLNPDQKSVERVMTGLIKNQEKHGERYCPCRRVTGDKNADKNIICPCIYHKDEIGKDGHCLCNLYVK